MPVVHERQPVTSIADERPPASPLPGDFRVALDPATRRIDHGSVLVGGNPLRLLRLTPAGIRLVDRLAAGDTVPGTSGAQQLVRRLLDGGLVHPRPGHHRLSPSDVTVIIPVRDHAGALARLLAMDKALSSVAKVIVVDDGSIDPDAVRTACAQASVAPADGLEVVWSPVPRGPGTARTAGVDRSHTEIVAFLDADCRPDPGWLEPLLAHFDDPAVGAAAPRVRPVPPPEARGTVLPAYEEERSPLDMGAAEDRVRPGGRVAYVPTAALLVRREAIVAVGGFDAKLTVGEDVDLVWRLTEAGWTVRYEPSAGAHHDTRRSGKAWGLQRFRYGTSAAPLSRRHPGALVPLRVSGWSALSWALAALGRPAEGAAVAATTTALFARRLETLEHPVEESVRIAGRGHLMAGRLIADALRRVWWPLLLVAALLSRRARRAAVIVALVPPMVEWAQRRPRLDPIRWCLLRLADDVIYGAGVWTGCIAGRTVAPLLPDLSNWPGRRPAVDD